MRRLAKALILTGALAAGCAAPGAGGGAPLFLEVLNNTDDGPFSVIHCTFEGSGGCSVTGSLERDESLELAVWSDHWLDLSGPINGSTFCATEPMVSYVNTGSDVFELLYADWGECSTR